MKTRTLMSIVAAATLILVSVACEKKAVEDEKLGLSKTSVFATPDPIVAGTTAKAPGENETWEPYFSGSPPLISHDVTDSLPIRIGENLCLDCHGLPDEIGQEVEPGDPTPIPASHYTDLRRTPDKVTKNLIGARFTCTQCHAPQADAEPLVANTYAP